VTGLFRISMDSFGWFGTLRGGSPSNSSKWGSSGLSNATSAEFSGESMDELYDDDDDDDDDDEGSILLSEDAMSGLC
jgi:hypothetical protein